jgi:hypothetical protein
MQSQTQKLFGYLAGMSVVMVLVAVLAVALSLRIYFEG